MVLPRLIDLFHNDFSIPQIPRGPLSLSLSLSLSLTFLFYSFTENTVPFLKKWVSHFGTNKLYPIEPNLWLLLNWVRFLITILLIKSRTFFHLCYGFLSSSSSSSSFFFFFPRAFVWPFWSFANIIHWLWKLLQSKAITIWSRHK